ncbi:hypothetical protein [uncultured Bifidobacterium sp.]|uniref:hypothetical protein n=1 Tax=uncultured Bifidobacterium sp. TaxID=165187 RepID=UPI002617DF5E|nr:hypothetical protein [uncultured Bifidobacterium sp.]
MRTGDAAALGHGMLSGHAPCKGRGVDQGRSGPQRSPDGGRMMGSGDLAATRIRMDADARRPAGRPLAGVRSPAAPDQLQSWGHPDPNHTHGVACLPSGSGVHLLGQASEACADACFQAAVGLPRVALA